MELLNHTLANLHRAHQGIEKMQAQVREAVYWPSIDADIADYVHQCTFALSTRPLSLLSLCFQEIFPMAHGRKSLPTTSPTRVKSICWYVTFSASTPSCLRYLLSLPSLHFLVVISQYRPPCLLYTDNSPPFASNELHSSYSTTTLTM